MRKDSGDKGGERIKKKREKRRKEEENERGKLPRGKGGKDLGK